MALRSLRGISLTGITDIKTLETVVERYPDCRFELSYLSTQEFSKMAAPLIAGRVVSIHMLTPKRRFFPNLASDAVCKWSEEEIMKDAELALEVGAENLVLHPGYIVDAPVPTDYEDRMEVLQSAGLEEFTLESDPCVSTAAYIYSRRYREAFERMKENALRISERLKDMGLHLCLENLNPRAGYLLLHPDEMKELAECGLEMCLDTGHMQVNAALYGFDLISAVRSVLETGAVRTMHLHSNPSRPGYYTDSHESLDRYIPRYGEIFSKAAEVGANLILEVVEEPLHNLELLFE